MDKHRPKSADLAARLREEIRAKLEQNLTTPAPAPGPGATRFGATQTCPSCGGTGRGTFSATCGTCSGSGYIGTY